MPASAWRSVQVDGEVGIPTTGVLAVAVTLTVVSPSAGGYVNADQDYVKPNTTVTYLNYSAGPSQSNTATLPVGSNGKIQVLATSATDMLIDVQGYYTAGATTAGGYIPVTPSRIVDTRVGTGLPKAQLAAGTTTLVQVSGRGGIPSGVTAVMANVTVVNQSTSGFLVPYAADQPRPTTSLNFAALNPDSTGAQLALSTTGTTTGATNIAVVTASVDLVVDVVGYFMPGASGGAYIPNAARILDTRIAPLTSLPAGQTLQISIAGVGGLPVTRIAAVSLDIAVVKSNTAAGYVNVWPSGTSEPVTSTVNYSVAGVVSNMTTAALGSDGSISLRNHGASPIDVVVDVEGWYGITYSASSATPLPGVTVTSDGWISFSDTTAADVGLTGGTVTTTTGSMGTDGGCDVGGGGSQDTTAPSSPVLVEEIALNPQTCQQRVLTTAVTPAAETQLENSDSANQSQPGSLSEEGDDAAAIAAGAQTDGDTAGADNTAYLPFGWHIKGWYKDPAYIVIDSLQLNMNWSSYSYPASTAHHIAYGWAAWAGLDRTYPQGAHWHDYSKTSTTVTHHVQEEFVNSTFADYVYGAFGAAGWAACGFTFGDTARFDHDLGLAGNRNGWVQWYWKSHKRGACVDLTRLDYKSWN